MKWGLALLICSVQCLSSVLCSWECGGGRKCEESLHSSFTPKPPRSSTSTNSLPSSPSKSPVVLLTNSWYESLDGALPTFHHFWKGKLLSQGSLFSWSTCGWHTAGLSALVTPPALHCSTRWWHRPLRYSLQVSSSRAILGQEKWPAEIISNPANYSIPESALVFFQVEFSKDEECRKALLLFFLGTDWALTHQRMSSFIINFGSI